MAFTIYSSITVHYLVSPYKLVARVSLEHKATSLRKLAYQCWLKRGRTVRTNERRCKGRRWWDDLTVGQDHGRRTGRQGLIPGERRGTVSLSVVFHLLDGIKLIYLTRLWVNKYW